METERLVIRRFMGSDWRDLYEYLSDEVVVAFEPYSVFNEEESLKETVRRAGDPSFWAVCLRESGKLIGNLYFCRQEPKEFLTWEIGFVFNRHYQGQGYAAESALRLLQYGFGECEAHRIVALCNPMNAPSWRLLERLGMRREGHFLQKAFFRRDEWSEPVWHDALEYALLADEWFTRK